MANIKVMQRKITDIFEPDMGWLGKPRINVFLGVWPLTGGGVWGGSRGVPIGEN